MTITPDEDDALEFTAEVQRLMDGLLRTHTPSALSVVKIDNWFGPRWLNFSGKALGALGIWKTRLTIPPFVPNRVVWQRTFLGPSYDELVDAKPIHIKTKSMNALKRYVVDVTPGVAIVWYSGKSSESGQGSMMAHVPTSVDHLPLYVGWVKRDSWRITKAIGITAEEVYRLGRKELSPRADRHRDVSTSA